jgi:hypothetical protein
MTRMYGSAWRRVGLWMAAGLSSVVLGCGSAGGYPDTGFGAGAPVPPTKTCDDFCARSADCFVALCNENTSSTRYTALRDVIDNDCLASCTDANLQAEATDASWQCVFTSSCRQVFEHDVCNAKARYSCP